MTALLRGMTGLLLWGAAFVTLYALSGLGCTLGWDRQPVAGISLLRALLLGTWLVFILAHLAWLAAVISRRFPAADAFWRQLELTVAVAGLVATLWTAFPLGVMTILCEQSARAPQALAAPSQPQPMRMASIEIEPPSKPSTGNAMLSPGWCCANA